MKTKSLWLTVLGLLALGQLNAKNPADTVDVFTHLNFKYESLLARIDSLVMAEVIPAYEDAQLQKVSGIREIESRHRTFYAKRIGGFHFDAEPARVKDSIVIMPLTDRKFGQCYPIFRVDEDDEEVNLVLSALGMGRMHRGITYSLLSEPSRSEYYVAYSDLEKHLSDKELDFYRKLSVYAVKQHNTGLLHSPVSGSISAEISQGLMRHAAMNIEYSLNALLDSLKAKEKLPNSFVSLNENGNYSYVLSKSSEKKFKKDTIFKKQDIERRPYFLIDRSKDQRLAVGWKLSVSREFKEVQVVVTMPLEEGYFFEREEVLEYCPSSKDWINLVF